MKIARNHLIAHPNRETLLQLDKMSAERDFPNLTISRLEDLLVQATNVASLAFERLSSEFWFQEWHGVSQLFAKLQQNQQSEEGELLNFCWRWIVILRVSNRDKVRMDILGIFNEVLFADL